MRRAITVECAVRTNYWDGSVELPASDMSCEGLWLDTPLTLEPGEELVVSFSPPGQLGPHLWAAAEVARVGMYRRASDLLPSGVGLSFTYLSRVDRSFLERALIGRPPRLPTHVRPPPLPHHRPRPLWCEDDDALPAVLDTDLAGDLELTCLASLLTSPRRTTSYVRASLTASGSRV